MRFTGFLVLLLAVLYTFGFIYFVAEPIVPHSPPCLKPSTVAIQTRLSSPFRLQTTMILHQNNLDAVQPVSTPLLILQTQLANPETCDDMSMSCERLENSALDSSSAVLPSSLAESLHFSTLTSHASWRASPFWLRQYSLLLLSLHFFVLSRSCADWIFSRVCALRPILTTKANLQRVGGILLSSLSTGWQTSSWPSSRRPRRRPFIVWTDIPDSRVVKGAVRYLSTLLLLLTSLLQLFVNRTICRLLHALMIVCHRHFRRSDGWCSDSLCFLLCFSAYTFPVSVACSVCPRLLPCISTTLSVLLWFALTVLYFSIILPLYLVIFSLVFMLWSLSKFLGAIYLCLNNYLCFCLGRASPQISVRRVNLIRTQMKFAQESTTNSLSCYKTMFTIGLFQQV